VGEREEIERVGEREDEPALILSRFPGLFAALCAQTHGVGGNNINAHESRSITKIVIVFGE
jgi:hypothetical protein